MLKLDVVISSSILQQTAKQRLQLPKDFVLMMDFDGTSLVEKANSDPFAKVTS